MKYKPLALAAAALMAGFLSFGGAQAANLMTGSGVPAGIAKMQDSNIQQASHRKWRRHSRRHHGWHGWRGHRRHSGIWLGLGLAPFYGSYYAPYYAQPSYYAPARGSRHVRWCLNHYRSYDVRSNTFFGFDGDRHRCRSPYRY